MHWQGVKHCPKQARPPQIKPLGTGACITCACVQWHKCGRVKVNTSHLSSAKGTAPHRSLSSSFWNQEEQPPPYRRWVFCTVHALDHTARRHHPTHPPHSATGRRSNCTSRRSKGAGVVVGQRQASKAHFAASPPRPAGSPTITTLPSPPPLNVYTESPPHESHVHTHTHAI
jgi:hypothetical protein